MEKLIIIIIEKYKFLEKNSMIVIFSLFSQKITLKNKMTKKFLLKDKYTFIH